MIEKILRSFNLNKKEVKAFNAVREFGTQPASNVARITEIPRNSVRFVLDGLVQKGLLNKLTRGNTQYYTIESKERIIRQLKIQKIRADEKFDAQIKLIQNFGNDLNPHSRTTAKKPQITFYEGRDGLEKVYEHTLSTKGPIKSWASFGKMHEELPQYFNTYYKRRSKKKIPVFTIHSSTEPDCECLKHGKNLNETVFVSSKKYSWIPEIQVYGNFVNIASWHEKLGILIESPEIAQALSSIFDLSFDAVKKDNKK